MDRSAPGHYFLVITGAGTHNGNSVQVTENKAALTYLLDLHRIPYKIGGRAEDPLKKLDRIFISVKDAEISSLQRFFCDAVLFMQSKYGRSRGFSLENARQIIERSGSEITTEWKTR